MTYSVVVVQNNGKGKTKKRAARANLFFCWLDILVLKPFPLPSPFSITRFNFFCLNVLTRASLLALAKSIYYYILRRLTWICLHVKWQRSHWRWIDQYITLYFNVSSTLLRKNRNTDFLYIYIYIYIYREQDSNHHIYGICEFCAISLPIVSKFVY